MTTTEVASSYSQNQAVASERPPATHRAEAARRRTSRRLPLLPLDALTVTAGVVLAELGAAAANVPPTRLSVLVAFPLLTLALLASRGTYQRRRVRRGIFEDLRAVVTSSALAAMVTLCARAFLTTDPGIAQQGARLWAFTAALVVAGRLTHHYTERAARRSGEGLRPTLIVGAGRVGRLTAERLVAMPELGLKPIGFLDKDPLAPRGDESLLPVLGASWDLDEVVREHGVEHVIISFSTAPNEVLLRLIRRCEELGLGVSMVPRLYELTTTRLSVEHIGGLPLVSAHPANPRGFQFALKYAADRLVSAGLVVLLSPILISAALATYLSLGRPIFFRQRRVGRDGAPFEMLKFRTMRLPSDENVNFAPDEGTAPGGVEGVDRRTTVGRFMRMTSLDELPQLFNVLRGEMSIVGPRPERPEFVEQFDRSVYRYGDRHRVKAGITGWAQVYGLRGQTSIDDRAEWDNYYIENFSLWLDAKILLMTIGAVFTGFKTVE